MKERASAAVLRATIRSDSNTFFSPAELDLAIKELLEWLNRRRLKKTGKR